MELTAFNEQVTSTLLQKSNAIIEKEMLSLKKEAAKQASTKILQIKPQILAEFKKIAYTQTQKVFLETYGENFDVGSLMESINIGLDNNLRPYLSYDKNSLIFNSQLKNNIRAFNQNAIDHNKFGQSMNKEELDYLFQNTQMFNDNPFQDAIMELNVNNISDRNVFSPINKSLRKGGFSSVDQTFEKAKAQVMKEFNERYKTQIKPELIKKYGINI